MKILIITRHYLDQNQGGPNCSKAFVKALSTIYRDVTLIYPEHGDHATDFRFMEGHTITSRPCYDSRSRVRKGMDVYRGVLHRYGKDVCRYVATSDYDVIFIDHSLTASSGIMEAALKSGARVVTLHHNVEKDYIRDNPESLLYRYPFSYFSLRAERKALQGSYLNLVLTQADYDTFAHQHPQLKETMRVMGMFDTDNTLPTSQGEAQAAPHSFVISGSLGAAQTETAVLSFLRTYYPLLLRQYPDATLVVSGRNPSQLLKDACGRYASIQVVPNPESLLQVIDGCRYYICPLYTGSGIKLRIMDGLKLGLPVLAHQLSLRGYEQIEASGMMCGYHDEDSFVQALTAIVSINDRDAVRQSYSSTFSFAAGTERLKVILADEGLL